MADYYIRRGQTVRGPRGSASGLFGLASLVMLATFTQSPSSPLRISSSPRSLPSSNSSQIFAAVVVDLAGQAAGTMGKAAVQVGGALKGLIAKKPAQEAVLLPAWSKRLTPEWLQTLAAEKQDAATLAQVVEKVESILMDSENITYIAVDPVASLDSSKSCERGADYVGRI
jgi:hypothetical protein